MFLYFDNSETLKEIINDRPFRQGNFNINKLYVYIEGMENEDNFDQGTIRYRIDTGETIPTINTIEKYFSTTPGQPTRLPFNPKRELKYFSYSKYYKFLEISVDNDVLNQPGNVMCTIRLYRDSDLIYTLGLITFNVEMSAENLGEIEYDGYISLSQFNYLMSAIPEMVEEAAEEIIPGMIGNKLYKHIITINTNNVLIVHSLRSAAYEALTGEGSVGEDLANGDCYFVSGTYDSSSNQLISGLISVFGNAFYFDLYEWEHSARLTPVYASNTIFVSDSVSDL